MEKYFCKTCPDNEKHRAVHNVMISPLSAIIKLELRVEVQIETDTHRNPFTCGDDSVRETTTTI